MRGHQLTLGGDEVIWRLEPSICFLTCSLYREIFKSATPCDLSGIWKARLPAKIKILLWKVARDRITSGDQVQKRRGPGDGKCIWCGDHEDRDHILFRCIMAHFVWSAVRSVTGSMWNPIGFSEFYRLVAATSGGDRRIAWLRFRAIAWALWTTRNKALIEGHFKHPADLLYKMVSFLQLWKLLAKLQDRGHVQELVTKVRARCTEMRRPP